MATIPTERVARGTHSCVLHPQVKHELSEGSGDKYGRMFPGLATPEADEEALLALGRSGAVMDDASGIDAPEASGDNHSPQPTRRIDARLVHSLIDLPPAVVGETEIPEYHSLAVRDLIRGQALELPSVEAIAREMGVEPLSLQELGLESLGWKGETPLWFYVLRESDVRAAGARLGDVGGRIVAEVLLGLIDADPDSYRAIEPDWLPTLPAAHDGSFTMADLLRFAGAA